MPVETAYLQPVLNAFHDWFSGEVQGALRKKLRLNEDPDRIKTFVTLISRAQNSLGEHAPLIDLSCDLDEGLLSVIKHALAHARLEEARRIEPALSRTAEPSMLELQQRGLQKLDALLSEPWATDVPVSTPRLSEYLTPSAIEAESGMGDPQHKLEEKFGILLSPSVLAENLRHHRERCAIRELPLAVAFADIDDFKQYNTTHTETVVDTEFLRRFLTVMEAAVYYRGEAYQQGGDECVLVLPHQNQDSVIEFLFGLQAKLETTENSLGIEPTVSVGVCIVEPDCMLTEREILERANFAESHAKKEGKDCVAVCDSRTLRTPKIEVFRRA